MRVLRQQRGLSQQELAEAMGLSRSAIAQWETNRGGQRDAHLERLAAVLGVPSEVFLNGMAENLVQENLSPDEVKLVICYRQSSVRDRLTLLKRAETAGGPPMRNRRPGACRSRPRAVHSKSREPVSDQRREY